MPINANRENDEENISAVTGNPFRRIFLNMEGAFLAIVRPSVRHHVMLGNGVWGFMPSWKWDSHNARELKYKSLNAVDQAEVRRHPLMSCKNQQFSRNSTAVGM